MEKVSMSHEDYLEAIVMLGGTTENPVRSVDIANKLGVSKASVNKAMNSLKEKGFADQPYYGDVTLTEIAMVRRCSSATSFCASSSPRFWAFPRTRPKRKRA